MTTSTPILMYHSVADEPPPTTRRLAVGPSALREQLAWLSDHGYSGMTFHDAAEALVGSGLPDRTVVLTFDDGYADFVTTALPLLRRYGFPATLFVTTGWVADAGSNAAGKPLDRTLRWDQIRELAQSEIEIGAHGHSHAALDELSATDLRRELTHSRALLEDCIGAPVPTLAYPFGYSNEAVRRAAHEAGYRYGAAVRNMRATPSADPFLVPRLTIRRSTGPVVFAEAVDGSARGWLPLMWRDRMLTACWAVVRKPRARIRRSTG